MRKLLLSLFAIFMLLFVSACADNNDSEDTTANDADSEEVSNGDLETEYPLTIEDAVGNEVVIEEEPEKIISTSTSDTETLFALGLDEQIVGVSDYDNYPEEALDKPKVGDVVEPNVEAILEQEPDLVVVGNSITPEAVEKIRDLDIAVYQTDPKNMEDTLNTISELALITNKQDVGEEIVNDMEAKISDVEEAVADLDEDDKAKVYIEFSPGWTVGSGEFMDELIEIAGGINIAADEAGWYEVNEEKIIEDDPDYILYAEDLVDYDTGKELDELIKERSGWDEITAIKEDQLIALDEDIISRNGPRIVDALEAIALGIYPERFE